MTEPPIILSSTNPESGSDDEEMMITAMSSLPSLLLTTESLRNDPALTTFEDTTTSSNASAPSILHVPDPIRLLIWKNLYQNVSHLKLLYNNSAIHRSGIPSDEVRRLSVVTRMRHSISRKDSVSNMPLASTEQITVENLARKIDEAWNETTQSNTTSLKGADRNLLHLLKLRDEKMDRLSKYAVPAAGTTALERLSQQLCYRFESMKENGERLKRVQDRVNDICEIMEGLVLRIHGDNSRHHTSVTALSLRNHSSGPPSLF